MSEATTMSQHLIPEINLATASRDEMVAFIYCLQQLVSEKVEIPIETLRLSAEISRKLSVDKTRAGAKRTASPVKAVTVKPTLSLNDLMG